MRLLGTGAGVVVEVTGQGDVPPPATMVPMRSETFPLAVVFDLDGTLTDTEHLWDEVRRGLAEAEGCSWPDEATTAMMGMSTQEWSTYLSEQVGLHSTPAESAARVIAGLRERYAAGLPLVPGAVAAVRRMAEVTPLGIASSSPRVLIEAAVEAMDVVDLVPVRVSTEEVAAGKPSPDGYLRACELLGADPSRCVAVEDSTAGIRSALGAGMAVVAAVGHFHPPAADLLDECAAVIHHLDELTPELVRGLR